MVIYDNTIQSTFDAVNMAVNQIDQRITRHCSHVKPRTLFKINFMLREILNNAVEHGNHFESNKRVHCRVEVYDYYMYFYIRDEGSGVDLTCQPRNRECEITLATRTRGLATVRKLDFAVVIDQNMVTISLDLRQEDKNEKDS